MPDQLNKEEHATIDMLATLEAMRFVDMTGDSRKAVLVSAEVLAKLLTISLGKPGTEDGDVVEVVLDLVRVQVSKGRAKLRKEGLVP